MCACVCGVVHLTCHMIHHMQAWYLTFLSSRLLMVDGGRGLVMAEWDGFLRAMWRLYQKASGGGVCTLHVLHWLEG